MIEREREKETEKFFAQKERKSVRTNSEKKKLSIRGREKRNRGKRRNWRRKK